MKRNPDEVPAAIDGGADVSAIAASYGGGGHKNAAGFTLPHGVQP